MHKVLSYKQLFLFIVVYLWFNDSTVITDDTGHHGENKITKQSIK